MNGYEVARSMRQMQKNPPHLIAMTGYGQPHDRQTALDAGFDSFFVKPIDPEQLDLFLSAGPK
jgi:CheY-like chemotaxis protein